MYVVTHVCTWFNTWITVLTHAYGVLCTAHHGQIATYWTNSYILDKYKSDPCDKVKCSKATDYAKVVCVEDL